MDGITREKMLKICQTGDILLFNGAEWYSRIIEWFSGGSISHVGMIIRNPVINEGQLDGIYLLQAELYDGSDDGVRLTPINHVFDRIDAKEYYQLYIRFLEYTRDDEFKRKVDNICKNTLGKRYDDNPFDWFKSVCNLTIGNVQKTSAFWCSALCTYAYIQLGFLNQDIPWTVIKPVAFSSDYKYKILDFKCDLSSNYIVT